jgi:hypothetical protein
MGRLKGMMVYLSGSMEADPNQGIEWREVITPRLKEMGVGVLNPCNKPTDKAKEVGDVRPMLHQLKVNGHFAEVHQFMKQIVSVDLRMVDISNFIIMKLNPNLHLCGSYWEAAIAVQQRKPLLICCEEGFASIPNWLYGITPYRLFFDTWEKLFTYLDHVDKDNEVDDLRRWTFFDYEKVFN